MIEEEGCDTVSPSLTGSLPFRERVPVSKWGNELLPKFRVAFPLFLWCKKGYRPRTTTLDFPESLNRRGRSPFIDPYPLGCDLALCLSLWLLWWGRLRWPTGCQSDRVDEGEQGSSLRTLDDHPDPRDRPPGHGDPCERREWESLVP